MGLEVVPRLYKLCDWMLNSSRDHFGSHQGKKNARVNMESEVFKRHDIRFILSIDMVQWVLRWERQEMCSDRKIQGPMAEKCSYNTFLMDLFFWEDKMMTREDK